MATTSPLLARTRSILFGRLGSATCSAVLIFLVLWRRKQRDAVASLGKKEVATHWQDHPLAAWALENGSIFLTVYLRSFFTPAVAERPTDLRSFLRVAAVEFVGGMLINEPILMIQRFLVSKVYAHRDFFPGKRPDPEAKEQLSDWCRPVRSSNRGTKS